MKYFKILTALLLFIGSLTIGFGQTHDITVQSINTKLSEPLLSQAAETLVKRLTAVGSHINSIDVMGDEAKINIKFTENSIADWQESLLTNVGKLSFEETVSAKQFLSNVGDETEIFHYIERPNMGNKGNPNSNILGTTDRKFVPTILRQLNQLVQKGKVTNVSISQGMVPETEKSVSLYLLSESNAPRLTGDFIRKCELLNDRNIMLQFNDDGSKHWTRMTTANVDKPVAILLDGQVMMAPVVSIGITGGKAQITGDYDDMQAKYMFAMIKSGALPTAFRIFE